MIFRTILLLALLFQGSSALPVNAWRTCVPLLERLSSFFTKKPFRYDFISNRNYLEAQLQVSLLNGVAHEQGIPGVDVDAIVRGEMSFLSLGEGDSRYALSLFAAAKAADGHGEAPEPTVMNALGRRAQQEDIGSEGKPVTNIFAVDVAYQNPNPEDFPANYEAVAAWYRPYFKGGLYQTMKLTNPDGTPLQVDRAVSLHSLGFVLRGEFLKSKKEAEALLLNILEHVKKGGTLSIFPIGFRSSFWKKLINAADQSELDLAFSKWTSALLSQLQNEGKIAGFSYAPTSGRLVIQR